MSNNNNNNNNNNNDNNNNDNNNNKDDDRESLMLRFPFTDDTNTHSEVDSTDESGKKSQKTGDVPVTDHPLPKPSKISILMTSSDENPSPSLLTSPSSKYKKSSIKKPTQLTSSKTFPVSFTEPIEGGSSAKMTPEQRRSSLIQQSLTNQIRRSSLAVSRKMSDLDCVNVGGVRRQSLKTTTTYGTMYTPLFQKLNILHRMSFADVVERLTLTWDNINVYVPDKKEKLSIFTNRKHVDSQANVDATFPPSITPPTLPQHKQILRQVSGVVEPGTLLAVMGASGSGKTTLLNVLTYRNRGSLIVNGDVRVNGGLIGKAMPSLSAYVQQEDVFLPTITVKEHLWFQSQLRMDREIPREIRDDRVDEVMREMGLHKCSDVLIGSPGKVKGISGGEKKRLAFASELLTNPPLMFLDEPTSGLDSYMAYNILLTLKTMASRGRSIVCTIHQPSSQLFELFDKLLLMSEGRVAYIGPANETSEFFRRCGYPIPPNYNPADHFVRVLAIEPGKECESRGRSDVICDKFNLSKQASYVRKLIEGTNFSEDGAIYEEESFFNQSPYKASWFKQFYTLLWRCGINNIREPAVFRIRLMQIIILSIIFSLVYWQQKYDQMGVTNFNGALFLMQMQMTIGFVFNVVLVFPSEFPVFLKEHHDGVYRADVYFLCKTVVELPQFTILPLIFTLMMYWTIGFYNTALAFFICFACNFMVCNVSVSFGYLLSTALNNTALAIAIGPLFITPCIMIGGYFVNITSIPIYFVWLKYLSWFTYANEILVVNQWRYVENIACDVEADAEVARGGRCFKSGPEIIQSLGYSESNMVLNFIMLLVLMVAFRIIAYLFFLFRARKSYKMNKNRKGL